MKKEDHSGDQYITLTDLLRILVKNKRSIIIATGVTIIFGLFYIFTTPKEYEIKTVLLPEVASEGILPSSLGNIAGLAGINIPKGSSSVSIPTSVYPQLLGSRPFLLDLLNQSFLNKSNESLDVLSFVLTEQRFNILFPPSKIEKSELNPDQKTDILIPSELQVYGMEKLKERIRVSIDKKTGIVSIYTEFQDPVYCAQIADFALDYIVDYVRDYQVEKETNKLDFIQGQVELREKEFRQKQDLLAEFQDSNFDLKSKSALTQLSNLENDVNLAFDIYATLRNQLEESRIRVQEEQPVIKIIEPVSVPIKHARPRKILIIVVCILGGGVLGATYTLMRILLLNYGSRDKY